MADLNILSNFNITVRGRAIALFQGTDTSLTANDAFTVEVDGIYHSMASSLDNATAVKVWDDDTHKPADFDFAFFVADVDMTLQFVGSATQFSIQVLAGVPFVMSFDKLLAAANTTDISGTEPTWEDIDHINAQNNSGGEGNYSFFCVD